MAVESEELSHLIRRSAADETIIRPVLCDRCLYDLRGLPGGGRCPECGQAYCGTGPQPSGVYRRERVLIPLGGVFLTALLALVAVWMWSEFARIAYENNWLHLTFGAGCAAAAMLCAVLTFIQIRRYVAAERRWREARQRRLEPGDRDGPWIAVSQRPVRRHALNPNLAGTLRSAGYTLRANASDPPQSPSRHTQHRADAPLGDPPGEPRQD